MTACREPDHAAFLLSAELLRRLLQFPAVDDEPATAWSAWCKRPGDMCRSTLSGARANLRRWL
jgi:hypothetical protein